MCIYAIGTRTYIIEAHWAMSSCRLWGETDLNFRLDDFYYAILGLMDEEAPAFSVLVIDRAWVDATLNWWKA
jgi:hypothetical protein